MKMFKTLSLALLAVAFVLGSCSKYEEGPSLSLRTKKARITGTWKVDKYVSENGTETESNDDSTIEIEKDGTYTVTSGSTSFSGTWEFNSDKSGIITSFEFGGVTQTDEMTIIKLRNDEMWLTDDEDYDASADHYGGYGIYVPA